MKTPMNAAETVGSGFPPDEGARLAQRLLAIGIGSWDGLTVDLSELSPATLIPSFFNALLQTIYDENPSALPAVGAIEWITLYGFQSDNVERWVASFRPVLATAKSTPEVACVTRLIGLPLPNFGPTPEMEEAERGRKIRDDMLRMFLMQRGHGHAELEAMGAAGRDALTKKVLKEAGALPKKP